MDEIISCQTKTVVGLCILVLLRSIKWQAMSLDRPVQLICQSMRHLTELLNEDINTMFVSKPQRS